MKTLRGILPVLSTPFDASGEIVESEVRALVNWVIEQGAHGISAVGEASESTRMIREERLRLAEIVFDETAGRVPVIVGVSAPNARESAILAEHAASLGADAVFLMPTAGASYEETLASFRRVADASGVPLMLQDLFAPLPVPTIARLVKDEPRIRYLKEEVQLPTVATLKLSEIRAATGPDLLLLGGRGGQALLSELQRGAIASMPSCIGVPGLCQTFDAWMAGDEAAARAAFARVAPVLLMRAQYNHQIGKAYLKRIGLFSTTFVREPAGTPVDEIDLNELVLAIQQAEGVPASGS
ncbi:MAG: dihydrodipicolinate synthase family protein [Chloroflexi bacterium]|nr:dihydrodipicolinate synthase family protein [Chloroflexota bacterium]